MAHADYQDLMQMTQEMLRGMLTELHGAPTVHVPIFDID
eukprot:CAMPEP_0185588114 /NCGR_PEP_ID=MMETSP0434-20130131/51921_1 /TAXON_ID=626734 ORGANISM="Favella taraikaensis, Strain Fe Narragansett Bay" /NCGR_SAMPLE_ID=MMETSP0434 /ASSEMBLY_ACC=CAM_ASM_000379 /LENGTH=38 /DNA_ID= /DNA_START= /DNA_END= /DNA_ORIENTATION=